MLMKAALILTCINPSAGPKEELKFLVKSQKRYARESFVAALCGSEILSPFCFKGACYADLFNLWIETCLAPVLKPGQVVILDNATFHSVSSEGWFVQRETVSSGKKSGAP